MPEPEPKSKGGRPKHVAEFNEGSESVARFFKAAKAVAGVTKQRIVELEQKHKRRAA